VIVDAQVHLWDEDRPGRPWPANTSSAGHHRLTAPQLLGEMDAAGVDRAVLVPPSWEGERNDVVLAAVHAHPDRFAAMGRVPLDGDEDLILHWTEDPGMLGIRITCHRGPQREWLTSDAGSWLWSAAARTSLPVMLYAPGLEGEVGNLLKRYPDLRLTLDHANLSLSVDADSLETAIERILPLSSFPNLRVKASGLECHVDPNRRVAQIGSAVSSLVGAFGADRVFWGTDLTRVPCTYRQTLTAFADGISGVSAQELSLILGEAIRAWLPWP
jgi:L-fuconolactonase